jgi:rhamnulokinase
LNFTNEGGIGGTICFLRNVNGLWLLDQCMEAWKANGEPRSVEELIDAAAKLPSSLALIDVDDPQLIAPGRMPERIAAQLESAGIPAKPFLSSPPAMIHLILHSLAARYAAVIKQMGTLTAKKFRRLYIVGGGSRNRLLNRLTQEATQLELVRGAQESSTVGNLSIQLAALENLRLDQAGEYRENVNPQGVDRKAVSGWAGMLANTQAQPNPVMQSNPA